MTHPSRLLLSGIFFVLLSALHAQNTGTLRGTIRDTSKQAISDAYVFVDGLNRGTYSDSAGHYSLVLPADTTLLVQISHVGHTAWFRAIQLHAGQILILNPLLNSHEIAGITVTSKGNRLNNMQAMPIITHRINPSVNQGIESLVMSGMGVSTNSELGSAYSVRGGSYEENLVYVNGIEVYRPFLAQSGQEEGLSFPNPDMVQSILFSSGGWEPKYGDKMSSVLDIQYKQPKEFGGDVTASLLGGNATIESATDNKRLTQITGFRYLTNRFLLNSLETKGNYNPAFTDLQSYWTYDLTDRLKLSFLGVYSNNKYNFVPQTRQTELGTIQNALRFTVYFDGQEITQYETSFGALSADYRPNDKTLLKFTASAYHTFEQQSYDEYGQYYLSELDRNLGSSTFGQVTGNIGVGGFLQHARDRLFATVASFNHRGYYQTPHHYIQWGVRANAESFDIKLNQWNLVDSAGYTLPYNPGGALQMQDLIKNKANVNSVRLMGFLQDTWSHNLPNDQKISATFGVRANGWSYNHETVISPRLQVSYKPNWIGKRKSDGKPIKRDIVLRVAGGYYYQPPFYKEMIRLDGSLNQNIKAQRSIHAVAGADVNFLMWGRPFKFTTEAYYKYLDRLIPYEIDNIQTRYFGVNDAKGYAAGIDFKLNGEFVKGLESWASLSFMRTEENLLNDSYKTYYNAEGQAINSYIPDQVPVDSTTTYPGYIPRPNDRRVFFSMLFQDEMPNFPSYKVHLSFVYGTGLPFGPPNHKRYQDVLRMPSYRRVDIGFSRDLIGGEAGHPKSHFFGQLKRAWVSVEVFNLLDISNTVSYLWVADNQGNKYSVPNYLTSRRINLKLSVSF